MPDSSDLGVEIKRETKIQLYPFTEYFQGFENVPPIKSLFGNKANEILDKLKVEFYSSKFGYMGVSDEDGHIMISSHHLRTGDFVTLYLDIVHELHHVKQFMDGKKLFLMEYEYVDSPIEVEAYLPTVQEARRIGLNDEQIIEYLKIDWISTEQHERLVNRMGLRNAKN
ncbi:MAG: hypothetical protein ACREBS_03855 [Nitrososphaerales archaeon]